MSTSLNDLTQFFPVTYPKLQTNNLSPALIAQSMNYTVVINSAVWGGALAYYYIDARKWFTGTIPSPNHLSFPNPPPSPQLILSAHPR